jgi:hypothetical protein
MHNNTKASEHQASAPQAISVERRPFAVWPLVSPADRAWAAREVRRSREQGVEPAGSSPHEGALSLDDVLAHLSRHPRQAGPFWRRIAKGVWTTAREISGCGPFASLCGCKGYLTVWLFPTYDRAREAQDAIRDHAENPDGTPIPLAEAGSHGVSDLRVYITLGWVRVMRRNRSLVPLPAPRETVPMPPEGAWRIWEMMRDYALGEQEKFVQHYAGGIRDRRVLQRLGLDPGTQRWARFLRSVRRELSRSVALWEARQP